MDISTVRTRVEKIEAMKGDDEMAHAEEDELFADLLSAIANGTCQNPAECAREALRTRDIKFARWCA